MPTPDKQSLSRLGAASLAAVGFVLLHMLINQSIELWYLLWNLGLAWVPVLCSSLLLYKKYSTTAQVVLLAVWLAFLPNAFYIITDIIHINDTLRFDQTFDVVVFMMSIIPGFLLGLISLWQIDRVYFIKGLTATKRQLLLVSIALLCGIAIYIGRELRWNSWDIVTRPFALLGDLAHAITSPTSALHIIIVTVSFAACILVSYRQVSSFLASRSSASPRHQLPNKE